MALVACIALTLAILFYVFFAPGVIRQAPVKTRLNYLYERKDVVYENLRDLNFEYRAGKLPDADYASLRSSLEEEAAAILADIEQREAALAARRASRSAPVERTKGAKA